MKHTLHKCDKEKCMICEGGLSSCTVCYGGEITLTQECSGIPLTAEQHVGVANGELNYFNGKWWRHVGASNVDEIQQRTNYWLRTCMGNAVADNADERYLRLAEEFAELMAACQAPLTTIISVIQAVYSKEAKKDSSEVGKISEECADVLICLSALATTHEVDLQEETHRILTRNWDNIDKIRAKHKNKKFKSAALIKDTTNGE